MSAETDQKKPAAHDANCSPASGSASAHRRAFRRALLNADHETVVEMLLEAYDEIDALRPDKARLDFADVHAYWDDGECGWTIHRPERGDIRTCIDRMVDRKRGEALDKLAAETQQLGLYDSPNTEVRHARADSGAAPSVEPTTK